MRKQLATILAKQKREVVFFEKGYHKAHGCVIDRKGNASTFWLDERPRFTPNKYFLEYQKDEEKSGITLTNANVWIIPTDDSLYIFRTEDLLESILIEDWKKTEFEGVKYFVIPSGWLEEHAKIYMHEDNNGKDR